MPPTGCAASWRRTGSNGLSGPLSSSPVVPEEPSGQRERPVRTDGHATRRNSYVSFMDLSANDTLLILGVIAISVGVGRTVPWLIGRGTPARTPTHLTP